MNNKQNKSKRYKKNKRSSNNQIAFNSVLTQFICSECYNTDISFEITDRATPLYKEKRRNCPNCKEKTIQICLKDKQLSKIQLEINQSRNESEEKAYQLIKKSFRGK